MLWSIWEGRNKKVFEGLAPNLEQAIANAAFLAMEWQMMESNSIRLNLPSSIVIGRQYRSAPPVGNGLIFNVDAMVDEKLRQGVVAVVVRDKRGMLVAGTSKRIPCYSMFHVEAVFLKKV